MKKKKNKSNKRKRNYKKIAIQKSQRFWRIFTTFSPQDAIAVPHRTKGFHNLKTNLLSSSHHNFQLTYQWRFLLCVLFLFFNTNIFIIPHETSRYLTKNTRPIQHSKCLDILNPIRLFWCDILFFHLTQKKVSCVL